MLRIKEPTLFKIWLLYIIENGHFSAQKHMLLQTMNTISNAQFEFQNIFFSKYCIVGGLESYFASLRHNIGGRSPLANKIL